MNQPPRRPGRPRRRRGGGAPGGEDRPSGQAGAINRSRPIYDQPARPRRGGPRRNGPPAGIYRPPDRGRQDARFEVADEDQRPRLPDNPREAALRVLHAVDSRSAFSDRMLDGAHSRGGDPRDLALLHELAKGTLRWRGRIDAILDPRIHIGLSQVQPWIRNVLRLGAYQILFLDRIPPHAAVDESVKLAHKYGHPGTAGLVNSVLRRLVDERDTIQVPEGVDADTLAVWGSHPRWITERWLERFGLEATRALLLADNRAVPVGLRLNALRGTREQLIERLAKEEVAATAARFSPDLVWIEPHVAPGALAAFREGWCTVQDESEALVSRLVAPQPHERLLDLCAAPGGKCTHLAELMGDEGEVWAMERAEQRVTSIENTITRLGIHSIHVVPGDGRSYNFPMPFDRVLVDAPCSGLGVLGRRADARWRKGPEVLREMPPIQLELLQAGARRARPGGVVVYSVCSFEPEETIGVVERFLRANPQMILESTAGILPDEVVDEQGFMNVLPHVHGCDGAFAARFRKT
jgi:16S rRNA (cytosine967-C5)-methyltransferase